MSYANKTKFEVQKIIRDCILEGFRFYGVDPSVYTVMEASQTTPTQRQNCILFKLESSARIGWQSPKFRTDLETEKFLRDDEFIEQQEWLISVMKLRRQPLNIETLMSDDVAQMLIAWFNGLGNAFLRRNGTANLVIKEKPVNVYKSESSVFERSSSFRVKLQVPKKFTTEQKIAYLRYKGNIPV